MTPSQRPAYEDTPFRHWVMVKGFCEHHGSIWPRSQVGEAVIRRDSDDDACQGYRRSDIEEIERRGDMDRGTGIVTFWMPWGNFPPIPDAMTTTAPSDTQVGIGPLADEPKGTSHD
jgi:hypothetical protein